MNKLRYDTVTVIRVNKLLLVKNISPNGASQDVKKTAESHRKVKEKQESMIESNVKA